MNKVSKPASDKVLKKYNVLLPEEAKEVHHYCIKVPMATPACKAATRHQLIGKITQLATLMWGRPWAHQGGTNSMARKCKCVKAVTKA